MKYLFLLFVLVGSFAYGQESDTSRFKQLGLTWSAGAGYGIHQFSNVEYDVARSPSINVSSLERPISSMYMVSFGLKKNVTPRLGLVLENQFSQRIQELEFTHNVFSKISNTKVRSELRTLNVTIGPEYCFGEGNRKLFTSLLWGLGFTLRSRETTTFLGTTSIDGGNTFRNRILQSSVGIKQKVNTKLSLSFEAFGQHVWYGNDYLLNTGLHSVSFRGISYTGGIRVIATFL